MVQLGLEGKKENPEDDEGGAGAGHEAGRRGGQQALDSEGGHQLHTAEAGNQIRGHQLQRLGQGSEGRQSRHGQTLGAVINYVMLFFQFICSTTPNPPIFHE